MGKNCPLQNAQPLGAKFQLIIFTSPRNGSDILCSSSVSSFRRSLLRRKDSKKRQNKINGQKRHHILVRLRSSARPECRWRHGRGRSRRRKLAQRGQRPPPAGWTGLRSRAGVSLRHMNVGRNLAGGQSDGFHSAGLSESKSRPGVERNAALQIGQGKGGLAITTVGCPDQIEQGVILIDGHQGSAAECPACGSKISTKHPNLADKRA